jgi:hypothetical protein
MRRQLASCGAAVSEPYFWTSSEWQCSIRSDSEWLPLDLFHYLIFQEKQVTNYLLCLQSHHVPHEKVKVNVLFFFFQVNSEQLKVFYDRNLNK